MSEDLCDQPGISSLPALLARLVEKADGVPQMLGSGPFLLSMDAGGLALHASADDRAAATRIDFNDPALHHRLKTTGKRQGIGKAVGLDKVNASQQVFVIDATAGLGRDSFVLAHLGCRVVMLERSPIIHALLADGLRRGLLQENLQPVLARMQLEQVDARQRLLTMAANGETCDVVYLDPMFPPREKSAKVKKDIALLHALLGSEEDLPSLLKAARAVAKYRVVLKRPDDKLPAGVPEPTLWLGDKPAAFAIYVNNSFSRTP